MAISLLGMVGIIAANGVSFGVTAWERSGAIADRSVEARVTQKFLRSALEGAQPIRLRDGTRTPPVLFEGGPAKLRFAAPLPAYLARRGAHLIEFAAHEQGGLIARWAPLTEAPPEISEENTPERLGAGWLNLRFRYYGQDPSGIHGWTDHWTGRDRLPAMVEIMTTAPGVAPVVIRLPAAQPADQ